MFPVEYLSLSFTGKLFHTLSVRPTRIERDSVNSVTVAEDQCLAAGTESGGRCSSRMMVSASVQLNPSGTAYTARDTTVMPPLPALLAILGITFAPNTELRFKFHLLTYYKNTYLCSVLFVMSAIERFSGKSRRK